jgi:hypothetical protein
MVRKYTLLRYPFIMDGYKSQNHIGGSINNNNNTMKKLNEIIDKDQFEQEYNMMCPGFTYVPATLPKVERVVVLGDIHGDYELAIKMLEIAKVISIDETKNIKWIGGNTHVVQVGDQIDRCRPTSNNTCDKPHTTKNDEASDIEILKLFTRLDKDAQKDNGRVISLLGNHELMNSQGQLGYVSYMGIEQFNNIDNVINDLLNEFPIDNNKKNIKLGFSTGKEARAYAFAPGKPIGKFLGCSRVGSLIIGSNLFVHAGMVDGLITELNLNKKVDLETINIAIRKWLLGLITKDNIEKIIVPSRTSMFWTRLLGNILPDVSFDAPECRDNISDIIELFKVGSIIIGHTPTSFTYADGINKTCTSRMETVKEAFIEEEEDGKDEIEYEGGYRVECKEKNLNKWKGIWRVDNGSSCAFSSYDRNLLETGKITHSRRAQVLEILNDDIYNILG